MNTWIGSILMKMALAGLVLGVSAAGADQRLSAEYSSFDGEIVEVVERYGANLWSSEAYFERSLANVTAAFDEELARMLTESRNASAQQLGSR